MTKLNEKKVAWLGLTLVLLGIGVALAHKWSVQKNNAPVLTTIQYLKEWNKSQGKSVTIRCEHPFAPPLDKYEHCMVVR